MTFAEDLDQFPGKECQCACQNCIGAVCGGGMLCWLAGDWSVSVTTGADVDESSSLTVAVRAYGDSSVSELIILNSSKDTAHFRPNAVDEFKVENKNDAKLDGYVKFTLLHRRA